MTYHSVLFAISQILTCTQGHATFTHMYVKTIKWCTFGPVEAICMWMRLSLLVASKNDSSAWRPCRESPTAVWSLGPLSIRPNGQLACSAGKKNKLCCFKVIWFWKIWGMKLEIKELTAFCLWLILDRTNEYLKYHLLLLKFFLNIILNIFYLTL